MIENTPEEIREAVIEMDERLKEVWVDTEEDERLQQRFWSIVESQEIHRPPKLRIGAAFLRQNQESL